MPKISVLVPVYNVEPYIEKCIRSIQNQTFTNFECIIVNDCTPDKSIELIQPIIEGDDRFRIVHHEINKGLGASRDTGLEYAQGEYVTFIDSDDYVEPEYLEQFYEVITTSGAIIIEGKFVGEENKINVFAITKNLSSKHHTIIIKLVSGAISHTIANKIFQKNVFYNYCFPSGFYEDFGANLFLIASNNIENIPQVPCAKYNYLRREGSITYNVNYKKIDDYVANVLLALQCSILGFKHTYLQKLLCYYEFIFVVNILHKILKFSNKPSEYLTYFQKQVQTRMPKFVYSFLQIRQLCSYLALSHRLHSYSSIKFLPIIRLYFKHPRLFHFIYQFVLTGKKIAVVCHTSTQSHNTIKE